MPAELLVSIGLPILLIVIGRLVGSRIERIERELRFRSQPALSTKGSGAAGPVRSATLATGSVVISVDHFKRFLSGFRMIFGGEIRSYSSLIDRARREAVLRMKESEPDAHAYINTRLETSTISNTAGNEGTGTVEVLAYGTAVHYDRAP
ncbi:MAG: heavy metal-binding domain-containing protein [Deltaproteobacteria bacterium]|nr:heavy metal-binding domain-containing protein [Deltaproteobacteria bacterium]